MEKKSAYNILVVLVACIGSFTYGYVISILSCTLGKPVFLEYMKLDTTGSGKSYANSVIAAWNCLLYVGAVMGGFSYGPLSDRRGRKFPISFGAALVTFGGAIQAGCVDVAMLAVARIIVGVGIGILLPSIPLYQAEVSPPHARGLMVGLHGSALGFGNMFAQFMGVAFFHSKSQVSWRTPLAIQCVFPVILFGLMFVMPESPRWLYTHGRVEQSEKVLTRLHRDKADPTDAFAQKEFAIMKAQIELELEKKMGTWAALRIPSNRKRFALGFLAMMGTQCSGLIVLLSYSPVIYQGLGFSPFMSNVMAGIWTIFNGVGNFVGALVVDRAGRRTLMLCGYSAVTLSLVGATVLTKLYAGTNTAGNKAAAFFVFLIICVYTIGIESPSFVFTSEIFPTELRAQGVAFSMQGLFLSSILWTAVAAPALSGIGPYFYIVFIGTSVMMIFVVFFFFPETKGYTLEQLSVVFGDEVVDDGGHRKGGPAHNQQIIDDGEKKEPLTEIETAETV